MTTGKVLTSLGLLFGLAALGCQEPKITRLQLFGVLSSVAAPYQKGERDANTLFLSANEALYPGNNKNVGLLDTDAIRIYILRLDVPQQEEIKVVLEYEDQTYAYSDRSSTGSIDPVKWNILKPKFVRLGRKGPS